MQSCRSKDPSDLPEEPVPAFFHLSPNSKLITVDLPLDKLPARMKSRHLRRSSSSTSEHRISSAFIRSYSSSREFKWKKEEKWHVIAKIYDEATHRDHHQLPRKGTIRNDTDSKRVEMMAPTSPPAHAAAGAGRRKMRGKKKRSHPVIMRTSSAESGQGNDEKEEETETLSTAVDSSIEFNSKTESNRERASARRYQKIRTKKKLARTRSRRTSQSIEFYRQSSSVSSSAEVGSPARLSVFKKLIPCSVEGKVMESFAIVKRSEDPYEDFKRSMMEMILEKQMFEESDLEQLLQCFFSLNSRHYHILIVEAFSEIWEAMFSGGSRTSTHRPWTSVKS